MSNDIDAVIAALKAVQRDAEWRTDLTWMKAEKVNRWIRQLPRTRRDNWKNLMIPGDGGGDVRRLDLIGHLHATLAYLEANREAISTQAELAPRSWWPFRRKTAAAASAPATPITQEGTRVVVIEKHVIDAEGDEGKQKYLN